MFAASMEAPSYVVHPGFWRNRRERILLFALKDKQGKFGLMSAVDPKRAGDSELARPLLYYVQESPYVLALYLRSR